MNLETEIKRILLWWQGQSTPKEHHKRYEQAQQELADLFRSKIREIGEEINENMDTEIYRIAPMYLEWKFKDADCNFAQDIFNYVEEIISRHAEGKGEEV